MPLQASSAPVREQISSPSGVPGDASAVNPSPVKRKTDKDKPPGNKMPTKVNPVESVYNPAFHKDRHRYEPYRKGDPTREPEGGFPSDPTDLKTLDATAKKLYKNDREILEYVESLKDRTAAILEYINRTDSQLRASDGAIKVIEQFVHDWWKMCQGRTHKQPFGDERNDAQKPNVFPTTVRGGTGVLPAVEEHISKNSSHPDFPCDYARDVLDESAPRPPNKEDENVLDSTLNRSGSDPRGITPGVRRLFEIPNPLKPDFADIAAAPSVQPPTDTPYTRHPLAQSQAAPSPELVHGPESRYHVPPHPAPRAPSPPLTVLGLKRKRSPTPEDISDAELAKRYFGKFLSKEDREDRAWAKRSRVITCEPSSDFQIPSEADYFPDDPPTRQNSPEPSPHPAHRPASPLSTSRSEESENERTQVTELLSREVVQGGSQEKSEETGNLLVVLRESSPAPSAENAQATFTENTGFEFRAPTESQVPAGVPPLVPANVFGPVALGANADEIQDGFPAEVSQKHPDGDVVVISSERETAAKVSTKSIRFNTDDETEERVYRVFPKTPIKPRTSLRMMEAENALAAEVEAESQDQPMPPPRPRKRRVRAPKPNTISSVRTEATGPPSASVGEAPPQRRRGRSASVQPEVPTLPKTPIRKSARGRK